MSEKQKKHFYKKWWFWVTAIIIVGSAASGGGEENSDQAKKSEEKATTATATAESEEKKETQVKEETTEENVETEVKEEDTIPREYKAALQKAELYAENMYMSKAAIYDQLVSEHGEAFPEEAAKYPIDNLEWDWKANALEKAKQYAETMICLIQPFMTNWFLNTGKNLLPKKRNTLSTI